MKVATGLVPAPQSCMCGALPLLCPTGLAAWQDLVWLPLLWLHGSSLRHSVAVLGQHPEKDCLLLLQPAGAHHQC